MISELFTDALKAHQGGATDKAAALYQQILAAEPAHADAANLLGVALCQQGDSSKGQELIARAISLRRAPEYFANYAVALKQLGDVEAAISACHDAIQLKPDYAKAHFMLGAFLRERGQSRESLAAFRAGVAAEPNSVSAFLEIAALCIDLGRQVDAAAACRACLQIDPRCADAHYWLGILLHNAGRREESNASFRRALAEKPRALEVKWRLCFGHLQFIYASEREIAEARAAYERDLREFAAEFETKNAQERAKFAETVGMCQSFYLPYQGLDDRPLQQIYGSIVCAAMQARLPQYAERPAMPPLDPGGKIRVGFVSGYFNRHSNWKIPIKGWIENLDREKFELFGYYVDKQQDEATKRAREACIKFEEGRKTVEEWARLIRADGLHVLIFPETGMDPMALKLAALRLAPVQAVSWGHPNTSGLPTIDYFLSSDLMEGPDGEQHYSERLVRLPNLSIHYTPVAVPSAHVARKGLGMRDDACVFWCCQTLFKYLPQHDEVFARIASQVGNCQFAFIRYQRSAQINEAFEERLRAAFTRRGLSADNHFVFLPHMDVVRFNSVARLCDVFLDSLEWSACNSLLESLAFDLPPVVMAGRFMRGRHGAAIMTMMNLGEFVAKNVDEFVANAVRLGKDPTMRQALRAQIAQRRHKLYGDRAAVAGLEIFLERTVHERSSELAPATR